jgi:hypothetical protein
MESKENSVQSQDIDWQESQARRWASQRSGYIHFDPTIHEAFPFMRSTKGEAFS